MKDKDIKKMTEYAAKLAEQIQKVSFNMQEKILNLTEKEVKDLNVTEQEVKNKVDQLNGELKSLRDKINNL